MNLPSLFLLVLFSINANAFNFYTIDLPPFSQVNDEEYSGAFHALAKEACRQANLDCTFNTAPWKRIMEQIKDGGFQGCYVVGHNKEREKWMHFTSPVARTEYGFFYNKKFNKKIDNFEGLKNKTVVVHAKSNSYKKLLQAQKKHPSFNIQVIKDIPTMLSMFSNNRFGKDTFLYGNKHIYKNIYKNKSVSNVGYAFRDRSVLYHFGFSKKSVSKEELAVFENSLTELKKNGTMKNIMDRYQIEVPN